MARVALQWPGLDEPIEVSVDRLGAGGNGALHVSLPDGSHAVEHVADGANGGWISLNGRVITYRAVRRGDRLLLWTEGRTLDIGLPARTARRAAGGGGAGPATGELTAPMPGTILQVKTEAGDTFEAHQPLIVMESMKMEMTISAPLPGRVREVLCAEGDLVDMGAVLARLEPPGDT